MIEAEKDLVAKFRIVLRPYVAANAKLQLTAVYALQVFNHDLGFPKGMLLRSFINCYELDILDEHAFIEWKEDTTSCDDYPGKGKALYLVLADYVLQLNCDFVKPFEKHKLFILSSTCTVIPHHQGL